MGEGVWSGWEMSKFLSSKNQEAENQRQPPPPPKKKGKTKLSCAFRLRIKNDLPEKHIFAFISISNLPRDKHMCIPS